MEKLVDFCAENGLDSLDATGYYFPGYPKVPSDETIYSLKRRAYVNGVAISFTAVKNDFTLADPAARRKEVQLVKDWIEVAVKLGAPMIRVFTGPDQVPGYSFDQVAQWMMPDFQECAAYGENRGVVVALQNHEDSCMRISEPRIFHSGLSLRNGEILSESGYIDEERYGIASASSRAENEGQDANGNKVEGWARAAMR